MCLYSRDASLERIRRQMKSLTVGMSSGGSSTGQRPNRRICVVQRISDGMKDCKREGSQRKSKTVGKECRTSEGQTDINAPSSFTDLKTRRNNRY